MEADAGDLGRRQRAIAIEPLLQRDAGHVFHHDVRQVVAGFDRVNRHDVIVTDGGGRPRFAQEALPGRAARRQVRGQHLDRDRPQQIRIERLEHDPKCAAAEHFENLVSAERAKNPRLIGRFKKIERDWLVQMGIVQLFAHSMKSPGHFRIVPLNRQAIGIAQPTRGADGQVVEDMLAARTARPDALRVRRSRRQRNRPGAPANAKHRGKVWFES